MKILLTILLFFCLKANAQSFVMSWTSGGHTKYIIQKSSDNNTWTNVATITAKISDTAFSYTLTGNVNMNFYRIVADTYIGRAVYIPNTSPCANTSVTETIQLKT